MYLHDDRNLFEEVIDEANGQTGIVRAVIEKDYYVTTILKLLAQKNPSVVFKGGTSLSKCFHLIDRFSEDMDITFPEHIGRARRKKLKYDIIQPISEELRLPIENWDRIESNKDYNYYLFCYDPVSDHEGEGVLSSVKLETALVSYSFPTEVRDVDSIIHDVLTNSAPDLVEEYDLSPFPMTVQSVSRTFIDKIFALCDYYLEGKTRRYSRHLYDIHKLYPGMNFNDEFADLIAQVREHRSHLSICPSAKEGVNIKGLIEEFLDKDFYRTDYEIITRALISDHVTYEQAAHTLREVADKLF